ncbi:MAG: PhzF family phenazine biosynthesis protein [Ectothiorhodospiraceae bacterium]|nr:PhzF family phenazine biosynthesis protein [Ectothiorhodospiraceae bacterium]MCH8504029.1 PhzF family phenazine biosynthesis protein [Ectothiorhodospiraceae bacterium]
MSQPLFIVDAFTDSPFRGNPAAVCLLDEPREPDWMQRVAAEMNLSETAFLVPQGTDRWDLRWFTPTVEVELCGHATLASAHVLWQERGNSSEALHFHTRRSGVLITRRMKDGITMDFPADPPSAIPVPEGLTEAMGEAPRWIGRGKHKVLYVLDSEAQVRALQPDLSLLGALDIHGVIATAPASGADYDFVSRFFAPAMGVPEDPVTGSAHCCLAPYWAERLDRTTLRGYQASRRGGLVGVAVQGDRVLLSGRAVTVVEGRLVAA